MYGAVIARIRTTDRSHEKGSPDTGDYYKTIERART